MNILYVYIKYKQTDRQGQTGRQTEIDGQIDIQKGKQIDRQT